MSALFLKIKIKSLAAEAALIRREERKAKGSYKWLKARDEQDQSNNPSDEQKRDWCLHRDLHHHRTVDVRKEARAAQIAYAYLRGKPLDNVEGGWMISEPGTVHVGNKNKDRPRWDRVLHMVLKYGPGAGQFAPEKLVQAERDKLRDWIVAAGVHEYVQPFYTMKNWR